MKKIFSLILLILALSGLGYITYYTLTHKGIREEVKQKIKVNIEKITSNESKNNISEIYNIYLQNEKHKVKIEYQLINKLEDKNGVSLFVYFDGKKVMEREVVSEIAMDSLIDIMKNDDIAKIIRINEKKFNYLKTDNFEFLVVDIGVFGEVSKNHYYIFDNNGDLIKEEGILVSDTSKNYMEGDMPFLNYYDNEIKSLAKIEENAIYALEEKESKKKLNLLEYKYFIKDGKLEKELVKTYENIALNKINDSKK